MSEADRSKWDARHRANDRETGEPDPFLVSLTDELPREGRALDVAGGAGRNAIWLARRGLDVTLVDISPVGLERARANAVAAGVKLDLVCADLEAASLPQGPFALVIGFNFLLRKLLGAFAGALAPGGVLVYSQPTRKNLERHARPPVGFLLEDGELPSLVTGLAIVRHDEDWSSEGPDGRHLARLVARKR